MHRKEVSFLSEGQKVTGVLVQPNAQINGEPGVIFVHGATSSNKNYIPIAERLEQEGIIGLAINLRGHQDSAQWKNVTLPGGLRDGVNAYDFLLDQGVNPQRIGFCGASYAGAIGVLLSQERDIKSIVLRVPATYTDSMVQMNLEQIMEAEENKFNAMKNVENTPSIKAIRSFRGDLLVIASENDVIIPLSMTHAFFDNAIHARTKKFVIMKDATHSLADDKREEFKQLTNNWMRETL